MGRCKYCGRMLYGKYSLNNRCHAAGFKCRKGHTYKKRPYEGYWKGT